VQKKVLDFASDQQRVLAVVPHRTARAAALRSEADYFSGFSAPGKRQLAAQRRH